MKDEFIIEQIAEIRTYLVINTFMLQAIMEHHGHDPESLLQTVAHMRPVLANDVEDMMRKAVGLDPRSEPRESVLAKLDEIELMRKVNWDGLPEV